MEPIDREGERPSSSPLWHAAPRRVLTQVLRRPAPYVSDIAPTPPEPVRPQPLLKGAQQRLREVFVPGGEDTTAPSGGRLFVSRELIAAQAAALEAWATGVKCLLDGDGFYQEWHASNAEEGAEHRVVYQDGTVF